MITVDELKAELRDRKHRQNTGYGAHGERIYAAVMRKRGHDVQSTHHSGNDFLIDGVLRADVKTSLRLGRKATRRMGTQPPSKSSKGVLYHRVYFYDDMVIVGSSKKPGALLDIDEVSWEEAARILDDSGRTAKHRGPRPHSNVDQQRQVCAVLKEGIHDRWKLKAKVVYRGNPKAQEAMGNWGPESFYHDGMANPGSLDLVVLIYFDGPEVQQVYAYPMREWKAIRWKPKTVGPNLSKRMTFDPAKLSRRYQFDSLRDFEDGFLSRFIRS